MSGSACPCCGCWNDQPSLCAECWANQRDEKPCDHDAPSVHVRGGLDGEAR